ncbi:unnamed protein product [Zymoseptoria tritici ST99CH_1E4]|uniref:Uncharacterized protein n=1 Tax=Zymoseptoria tritici ST99CH_1E4 TaxID=1276532 RepID=A0A2H1GXG0_ZYMTR|nr:unnamed protein product [Zymoseptoria tritici ST99CH_1E4]
MKFDSQLKNQLWPELIKAAVFINNRLPSTALRNWKSPFECLYGMAPDIDWIRRVGYRAYKLVPKRKFPKKYDERAHVRVLVGFEGHNLFRLWDPISGKIKRAKEVLFDENVRLNHNKIKELKFPPFSSNEIDHIAPLAPEDVLPHDAIAMPKHLSPAMEAQAAGVEWEKHGRQGDVISNPVQPIAPPKIAPLLRNVNAPPVLLKVPSNPGLPTVNSDQLHRRIEIASMVNYACIDNDDLLAFTAQTGPIPVLDIELEDDNKTPWDGQPKEDEDQRLTKIHLVEDDPIVPKTHYEATHCGNKAQWEQAITEENESLQENDTWEIVDEGTAHTPMLSGRWVFTVKRGLHGEITRYKARWVVRGFEQREGINFLETFAAVVKLMSYRIMFALAAKFNWHVHQMDVKTAFLYGKVEEEIYVELPPGSKIDGKVCKLKKALYGLKQAPRVWYNTLNKALSDIGFSPCVHNKAVFKKDSTFILVYVDDLLIAGPDLELIKDVKQSLSDRFKIKDMGECEFFLGIGIERDRSKGTIKLTQKAHMKAMLERFGLLNANPAAMPFASGQK